MQRLTTARFLLANDYNLDALYLAGYSVECSLKALILQATPDPERPETLKTITSGKRGHDFEFLAGLLKDLKRRIPEPLVKKLRRAHWSTNLRYETGRTDTGETRAFLKTAEVIYDWVDGELP